MSAIPEARDRLRELRDTLLARGMTDCAAKVDEALSLMVRRPLAKPRAPTTSKTADPGLADQIRAFAHANRHLSQQQVAELFGVNHGRVSEALHGDR